MSEEIRPEVAEPLRAIAARLAEACPPGFGFAVFMFDFAAGGHISYISNARREDMRRALREFLEKWEREFVQ